MSYVPRHVLGNHSDNIFCHRTLKHVTMIILHYALQLPAVFELACFATYFISRRHPIYHQALRRMIPSALARTTSAHGEINSRGWCHRSDIRQVRVIILSHFLIAGIPGSSPTVFSNGPFVFAVMSGLQAELLSPMLVIPSGSVMDLLFP